MNNVDTAIKFWAWFFILIGIFGIISNFFIFDHGFSWGLIGPCVFIVIGLFFLKLIRGNLKFKLPQYKILKEFTKDTSTILVGLVSIIVSSAIYWTFYFEIIKDTFLHVIISIITLIIYYFLFSTDKYGILNFIRIVFSPIAFIAFWALAFILGTAIFRAILNSSY